MSDRGMIIEALEAYYFALAYDIEKKTSPSEMIHLATFLLNVGTGDKAIVNDCAINVVVEDSQLDQVIEKANSLKQTLLEFKTAEQEIIADMTKG